MEFTIEDGKLFMLQTRNGKRTAQAALQIACDLVDEGVICLLYTSHCDIAKAKWQGLYGTAQVEDHKVVLLKPLTYMNLSGQSIACLLYTSLSSFVSMP